VGDREEARRNKGRIVDESDERIQWENAVVRKGTIVTESQLEER
jgi:hypothetical protein